MTIHWTYEATGDKGDDLRQGDILFPSSELLQVLGNTNSQSLHRKPLGYMIVTQCCDLVRREPKSCKATYISIVEVRELSFVFQQLLDSVCEKIANDVFLQESKSEARELLTRLFNQNEQALGLFYLHPCQESTGLTDESVALLRVSTPVPTAHYETLLRSRRGRLTSEFRNKVGWLVGNLYSRVGTPDWTEQSNGKKALEALVSKFLDADPFLWVKKSWVQSAENNGISLDNLPRDEILSQLENFRPKPAAELIAAEARKQLEDLIAKLPQAIAGTVSQTAADLLLQNGITIARRDISTLIETELRIALSDVFNEIALRVAKSVTTDTRLGLAETAEFQKALQLNICQTMLQTLDRLPEKLSGRLSNSPIARRFIDRDAVE